MSEVFISKHLDYEKIAIDVIASPTKKNYLGLTQLGLKTFLEAESETI